MILLGGIDIGGTKCAVSLGECAEGQVKLVAKSMFPTPHTPELTLTKVAEELKLLLRENGCELKAIGISCGGPLDSRKGLVLSPPNLPGWERVDVIAPFKKSFNAPVFLENDANACALAEWQWGAGQGCRNVVFLTFGTGMGAGLILNGQLYSGTNDLAGEVGHIRLDQDGPVGFGKAGSFEGFCSGGGIAKLAQAKLAEHLASGGTSALCGKASLTARSVGEAAQAGDEFALEIFSIVGKRLGQGLALLVDILNPERIIIGSIYGRQQSLLEETVWAVLKTEAIPSALAVCTILPAGLGEQVGDYASLSVASYGLQRNR